MRNRLYVCPSVIQVKSCCVMDYFEFSPYWYMLRASLPYLQQSGVNEKIDEKYSSALFAFSTTTPVVKMKTKKKKKGKTPVTPPWSCRISPTDNMSLYGTSNCPSSYNNNPRFFQKVIQPVEASQAIAADEKLLGVRMTNRILADITSINLSHGVKTTDKTLRKSHSNPFTVTSHP